MAFFDSIFSLVWDISDYFYEAYLTAEEWVFPFNQIAGIFYWLSMRFWALLTPIAQASDWAYTLEQAIGEFLSSSQIINLLRSWLDWAEWAWAWITDAWYNVVDIVEDWWTGVAAAVQAWIDQAFNAARDLINQVSTSLSELRSSWDDFWTITWPAWIDNLVDLRGAWDNFVGSVLPGLATWTGSQSLIESILSTWFPFYDELVLFMEELREFFADPGDYMIQKLEDALERLW